MRRRTRRSSDFAWTPNGVTASDAEEGKKLLGFDVFAMHKAASHGDIAHVRQLIAGGADVNLKSLMGRTPLHLAVVQDHAAVVEMLLAAGADRECKTSFGKTPLQLADLHHEKDVARILREAGALEYNNY
ncbi:ankyrin repeat-containing domain protein [Baffinella frigidus]|nr:ankyrin repeat-containing domain protein [Cryptophyta sp. CCMP2293]